MITIRGTQLPEDEKYTSAIFLDNDPDKIKNVNDICPRITTISIPQTSHKVDPLPFNSYEMKTIIEAAGSYDDNIYIHLLHKFGYGDDSFDPISGINPRTHGSQLKQWIDSRNDPTKSIILLDWDRTITVIEGFIAFDYEKYAEYSQMQRSEYYNDFLRYLCGGDLRLFHIRELLDYAGERNIDVCILTNNNACDSDIFLELVNTLVPHSVENLFVACSLYEPFNGHKGLKLKSIEAFSDLCIMGQRAGFRRRSRRLRQRHGRKSRTKRGRFNKN